MDTLFSKKNVIGVGSIGKKVSGGKVTDIDAVRVYVSKKEKGSKLKKKDRIDAYVDGVPTDIIEIGEIKIQAGRKSKVRPIKGGYSEGNIMITAGTAGPLVRTTSEPFTAKSLIDEVTGDRVAPNTIYRLSNAHVYCEDTRKCVSEQVRDISQPGPLDDNVHIQDNIVGRLESHVIIAPGKPVTVDAALRSCYGEESRVIEGIGELDGFTEFIEGESVTKSGRTTEVTEGVILDESINISVNYGGFTGTVLDCYLTPNMSKGGDSGSTVVRTGTKKCGGILFAGSTTHSLIIKASNILGVWNLEVATEEEEEPVPPTPPVPPLPNKDSILVRFVKLIFAFINGIVGLFRR